MNSMGISTDPAMLDVELPRTLLESASVSTFLPEEEASVCPLLSNGNGSIPSPLTFSHPLTPGNDTNSDSMENNGAQMETRSSSGSSSGIGMDAPDSTSSPLFNNKHAYHHLQLNSENMMQESNGHGPNNCAMTSENTPSFVSWNWPLIRKTSFVVFMSILMSLCALVVAMIVTLPKTCNPKTSWYRGSVFYEIFPASFQDSNNDGLGDIRGITNRVEYFASLNVRAIRLNSIFPSMQYPEDYENVTSLTEIAKELGTKADLQTLAKTLHAHNISLILDLPLKGVVHELGKVIGSRIENDTRENDTESTGEPISVPVMSESLISEAIHTWTQLGVDGFYIKGLEVFIEHMDLMENFYDWKRIMGPDRVLIISENLLDALDDAKKDLVLGHVNLVDVHLDVQRGVKYIEQRINDVLTGRLSPKKSNVWIHWSIASVQRQRITNQLNTPNITLASTIMQLMLPGTPSIFYGDEIGLAGADDLHNDHANTQHLHHLAIMQWPNRTLFTNQGTLAWLPQSPRSSLQNIELISKLIALRDQSPSLYNNAICKIESKSANTVIRRSLDDILIIERTYPRRNTFVSITNYGAKFIELDMTALYYSGIIVTSQMPNEKMYFKNFHIGPHETLIVKLDK